MTPNTLAKIIGNACFLLAAISIVFFGFRSQNWAIVIWVAPSLVATGSFFLVLEAILDRLQAIASELRESNRNRH